jgi:hypothetical protein
MARAAGEESDPEPTRDLRADAGIRQTRRARRDHPIWYGEQLDVDYAK